MIYGIILAGGQARRMGGGDKALLLVGGQSVLARTIAAIQPQVNALAISANGDPARFAAFRLPLLPDAAPDQGPLAGILAGLDWAAAHGATALLSVPGDCPFLPDDLAARLQAASRDGFAQAASGNRTHPVIALWPTTCREDLRTALASGLRRVEAFASNRAGLAEWRTHPHDPFLNVNTPEDLAVANQVAPPPPAGSRS